MGGLFVAKEHGNLLIRSSLTECLGKTRACFRLVFIRAFCFCVRPSSCGDFKASFGRMLRFVGQLASR
jgi:hypothetical protein